MLKRFAFDRRGLSAHLPCFALAALLTLGWFASHAAAQTEHVKPAPPGDSLATPGPLAQDLSPALTRPALAQAMKRVADWQLGRLPAQPQYDWTFAALYAGFMGVPDEVAGDKYKKAMEDVANGLNWQPGPRVLHADDLAVGQMYVEQYLLHQDPKMLEATRARLDQIMANGDEPAKPLWWWCDALFMAPPVFADMTVATGDKKYVTFMDHEWTISTRLLYDTDKHLYYRDLNYFDRHEKNGEKIFWSRGNGWVMGGLVRILERLPKDSPLRPRYEKLLREMAAEAVATQGKDGLWRAGMLDAASYPLPEVSGSAFITYALAYGVNEKILDRKTYWPAVEKAWAGMLTHVYADGRLGSIQPVGAAPGAFTETSSYVYGVGAYLLAGAEIYRTAK
jgi:rhamnogalacturonyl hydrolase YesR